jgi:hypothetical protein
MVGPIEMRGRQLIDLSLVMRQRQRNNRQISLAAPRQQEALRMREGLLVSGLS